MTVTLILAALGAGLCAAAPGAAQPVPQTSQPPAKPASHRQPTPTVSEGERVFEQNCSRCHNAPEGFSTRISGTIVRHMGVRASLSEHDEQELLRYLNP
ncbi:MAG TPA: cytochrome c [Acidobacteriaceae bacterium]|nr:cytochrome c [Acidobacteriaceae bacterium]